MLKRILTKKTGVTLLEGLIALGLLALVAGGAFGVLLSVSRKSTQPDLREEMIWAVEQAHDLLQAYVAGVPEDGPFASGLCGGDDDPLSSGNHTINCMLPAICDVSQSSFSYSVDSQSVSAQTVAGTGNVLVQGSSPISSVALPQISYTITCNGYTL